MSPSLYSDQTAKALQNFPISGWHMPAAFIHSLALIKEHAALVNGQLGEIPRGMAKAIAAAARSIQKGDYADQFPVDVFQTGSGTSSNMNVNEVIAGLVNGGWRERKQKAEGGRARPRVYLCTCLPVFLHTYIGDTMKNPYDILFETVRIGPVIAPNRFYQVPHCNGMGHRLPQSLAAMRGIQKDKKSPLFYRAFMETVRRYGRVREMELMARYDIDPAGKHAVIIGRSNIVGKPIANIMIQKQKGANSTVTICHTRTKNMKEHTLRGDILIVAAGAYLAFTVDDTTKAYAAVTIPPGSPAEEVWLSQSWCVSAKRRGWPVWNSSPVSRAR